MLNINLSRISPDLLCWKTLVRPRCVGGRIERMKVKEDSSFTTSQRHGVTARDTWQQHKTWHVTTVYRILRGADDCISSAPSHQLVNRVEGSRVRGYLYTLPLIYLTSFWCCLLLKLGHLSAKKSHFQHADNLLKCLKASYWRKVHWIGVKKYDIIWQMRLDPEQQTQDGLHTLCNHILHNSDHLSFLGL